MNPKRNLEDNPRLDEKEQAGKDLVLYTQRWDTPWDTPSAEPSRNDVLLPLV